MLWVAEKLVPTEYWCPYGTHCSARHMCLKSWHLLQPIANLSFVCFICWNFIPSKIVSSKIISRNSFTLLIGYINRGSFIVHAFRVRQAKRSHCQFSYWAHAVLLPGTWWLLFLQSIHVPSQYKFPQRFWLAILCSSPFLSKSPNSKTSAFVHLEHFFLYSSIAFHLQDGQRAWCSVLRDVGHLLSILTKSVFTREQKCAIRMIVQLTVILMMVFRPVCTQISIT